MTCINFTIDALENLRLLLPSTSLCFALQDVYFIIALMNNRNRYKAAKNNKAEECSSRNELFTSLLGMEIECGSGASERLMPCVSWKIGPVLKLILRAAATPTNSYCWSWLIEDWAHTLVLLFFNPLKLLKPIRENSKNTVNLVSD